MDRFSPLCEFCRKQFALDLRSLACFRVGLGTLILLDLLLRLEDLTAFYTDQGIVPRSLLSVGLVYPSQWSFHLMNGTATFQLLLFLVTGIAAGMVAAGYRTRLATTISWLMLVSLHTRNPIVLNAGDKYLELLTFWAIFLPLGACWSVDTRQRDNSQRTATTSLATFALHIQILLVYLSTGLLKQSIESWQTGDAVRLALSKGYLVTGIGQQLLGHPKLTYWLTHATVYLEIWGPIALLLSRGWFRFAAVVAFAAFHLGLALCFSIGLFPYVCIVAFTAFLPSEFWVGVVGRTPHRATSAQLLTRPALNSRLLERCVIAVALLIACWSNLETLGFAWKMPEALRNAAVAFRWPQSWRLFVDLKDVDSGWFVFHAQFADGTSEDLLTGASPVSYERPELASATFPNFRWRKLCTNIRLEKFKPVATYLGEYLLLERDRTHHDVHNLAGLEISYVKPSNAADNAGDSLVVFGRSYMTSQPLMREVLFEWQNEARKYHDVFIRE